jgi:hypothetical protein
MHIDASFPMMVRCMPAGSRKSKMLKGVHIEGHDVPDISIRDTEIAVRRTNAYLHLEGAARVDDETVLRAHSDRLYRRIARRKHLRSVLETTFRFPERVGGQGFSVTDGDGELNTVSLPVLRELHKRQRTRAGGAILETEADGDPVTTRASLDAARDVDIGDMVLNDRLRRRQLERLIAIDGDLWYECTPAYCVETIYGMNGPLVVTSVSFLPDFVDEWLTRKYFPLDRLGEAMEFSSVLSEAVEAEGHNRITRVPTLESAGVSAFTFDHEGLHRWRTAAELARSCRHSMTMYEKGRRATLGEYTEAEGRAVGEAADAGFENIDIIDGHGDLDHTLEDLFSAYSKFSSFFDSGYMHARKRGGEKLFRHTLDQRDIRPISIHGLG